MRRPVRRPGTSSVTQWFGASIPAENWMAEMRLSSRARRFGRPLRYIHRSNRCSRLAEFRVRSLVPRIKELLLPMAPHSHLLRGLAPHRGHEAQQLVPGVGRGVEHQRAAAVDHGDAVLAAIPGGRLGDAADAIQPMHPHVLDAQIDTLPHGGLGGLRPGADHHRLDTAGNRLQILVAPVAFHPLHIRVDREHLVAAINPNVERVEGDRCYQDLKSVPGGVEAVVIGTRPESAEATMRECVDLGIKDVWMHRLYGAGSVSEAATRYGRQHGITVIDGGCPLMFDPTADPGHKLLRFVATMRGKAPKQV